MKGSTEETLTVREEHRQRVCENRVLRVKLYTRWFKYDRDKL